MSAVLLGEDWQGRKTSYKDDGTREHTRVFRVKTTDPQDGGTTAASVCPPRGAVHNFDSFARCKTVEAGNEADDRQQWRVTCTYTTEPFSGYIDPTEKPTKYTYATEFVEKAVAVDLDDQTIENSAFETFEQPASVQVPVTVITAKCVRATYTPATDKHRFVQKVNDSQWSIGQEQADAGQAIIWDITVESRDDFLFDFTYVIKIRRDIDGPWQFQPLDMGFNEWDGSNLLEIMASNGQPLQHPSLLDGNGRKLANNADPVNLSFRLVEEVNANLIIFP